MPIYEYQCRSCEHTFEALVDGDEVVSCPTCRNGELERLLSVPARPTATTPLKTACQAGADVPPCGPACSRWNG